MTKTDNTELLTIAREIKAELAVKAQDTPDKYLQSSIRIVDGSGRYGSRPLPFSYAAAVQQCRSWVYAAVTLKADAAAAVPIRLYQKGRPGTKLWGTRAVTKRRKRFLLGDGVRRPSSMVSTKLAAFGDDFEEVVEVHPSIQCLRRANPFMSGFDLLRLRFMWKSLTGNAYETPVIGDMGYPEQLWPMPSQWSYVIPDAELFVKGYAYGVDRAKLQEFAPDEVIHYKNPNPWNLFYGLGDVEAGWGAIGLHNAERQTQTALFENNARPDYAIICKGGATDDQLKDAEKLFEKRLLGTRNRGRFVTMTGDIEIVPLNFPPSELGDQDKVIEEIAAVFKVPITKLKANDPNRASAEMGDYSFYKDTIAPMLRCDEETLNEFYLPLFGIHEDAVLAYDDPVPENLQFEVDTNVKYVGSGVRSINEIRADAGDEPFDNPLADQPLINGQPLGQQPQQQPAFGLPGGFTLRHVHEPQAKSEPVTGDMEAVLKISEAITAGRISIPVGVGLISRVLELTMDETEVMAKGFTAGSYTTQDDYTACMIRESKSLTAEGKSAEDTSRVAHERCQHHLAAVTKDCGTGAGGFQPGNDCAGGGGGGGGESSGNSGPSSPKSDAAAAVLDQWGTPATGSRAGEYEKIRAEGEAWVKGGANKGFQDLYGETQSALKASGTKEITSYRGLDIAKDNPLAKAISSGKLKVGQEFSAEGMSLTSWSESKGVATHFADKPSIHAERESGQRKTIGVVVERVVPAKDVVSTSSVHSGLLSSEKEVIAKNNGTIKLRIVSVHGL